MVFIVDRRRTPGIWSGLTLVDDRAATIAADEDAHRRRWAGWLYWGNLLQFLTGGEGDGLQLAYSDLASFDPTELSATEGSSTRRYADEPLDGETATWLGRPDLADPVPPPSVTGPTTKHVTPQWAEVLDLIDPEESGLESFIRALMLRGAPLPEVGYELGPQGWQAEVAWPDRHVGVMLGGSDDEVADRDQAYQDAGWHVATAKTWTVDELLDELAGSSS